MGRVRVYIRPFTDFGNYGDFTEVTEDVNAETLGTIKQDIDSTEYDAGIFKYSSFSLSLANESGNYSDVDNIRSIFRFKRTDSVVKITWDPNTHDFVAGTLTAGQMQLIDSTERIVFQGLINDEASTLQIKSQEVKFQCFGFESLFQKMDVPFSILSAGDTLESIIYDCLNQDLFTEHVTVDLSNINPDTDTITDTIAELENKTVKEAMDDILVVANSVLYIRDNTVYVVPRVVSASLVYTFYGQASNNGIENISDISNIRTGLNRIFNLWTWEDSTLSKRDGSSVSKYGVRKKEVSSPLITDTTKRNTVLTNLKDEFFAPKQEVNVTTGVDWDRFDIGMLDKVRIDYPTVYYSADGEPLPLWGSAVWADFKWPLGEWSITIPSTRDYKIIGITYNLKAGTMVFKAREV